MMTLEQLLNQQKSETATYQERALIYEENLNRLNNLINKMSSLMDKEIYPDFRWQGGLFISYMRTWAIYPAWRENFKTKIINISDYLINDYFVIMGNPPYQNKEGRVIQERRPQFSLVPEYMKEWGNQSKVYVPKEWYEDYNPTKWDNIVNSILTDISTSQQLLDDIVS